MFYSGGNVLDYFRIPNAIDVTWAHRVNGLNDLTTSLTGITKHNGKNLEIKLYFNWLFANSC